MQPYVARLEKTLSEEGAIRFGIFSERIIVALQDVLQRGALHELEEFRTDYQTMVISPEEDSQCLHALRTFCELAYHECKNLLAKAK
jgi:hypothetical protein